MSTVREKVCVLCGEAIGLGHQFFTGTGINRDTYRHVECVAAQPWKVRAEKAEAVRAGYEKGIEGMRTVVKILWREIASPTMSRRDAIRNLGPIVDELMRVSTSARPPDE